MSKRKTKGSQKWVKRSSNYARAGYQLYKDVKKLKQLVNVEIKKVNNLTLATPGYVGQIVQLNTIAQGDTDTTRDGDSLKLQKLKFSCLISNTRVASARVVIFWDQQNVVANPLDLLDNVGTADGPLSYKNYDKRFQSKILMDRRVILHPNSQARLIEGNLPIHRHTQFEAGTTTINTGALKVLFLGDAAAAQSTFRWISRLSFTDN